MLYFSTAITVAEIVAIVMTTKPVTMKLNRKMTVLHRTRMAMMI